MSEQRHAPASRRSVISPGLWKGYDVECFPPSQGHPLRHFKLYADAFEHAQALRRAHGWEIIDNTFDGPEAA